MLEGSKCLIPVLQLKENHWNAQNLRRQPTRISQNGKLNFAETKGGHKSAMVGEERLPRRTVAIVAIALFAIKQINNFT